MLIVMTKAMIFMNILKITKIDLYYYYGCLSQHYRYKFTQQIMIDKTKPISKAPKKYVPTPSQTKTIMAYFVYNNYQDFNTWQQISKSKCQFEYVQLKNYKYLCKATLKFDDPTMPIISQHAESRTKKNSKKKALYKIIQQLLHKGIIGLGFREKDYITKIPKRRKQSSDDDIQSQESDNMQQDKKIIKFEAEGKQIINRFLQTKNLQECLSMITENNFERLWCICIKNADFYGCISIIRKLQNVDRYQENDKKFMEYLQSIFCEQMVNDWQDYYDEQFRIPDQDLTDYLVSYQLQLPRVEPKQGPNKDISIKCELLPSQNLQDKQHNTNTQGNTLFQFFYPIENTFNYLRTNKKSTILQKNKKIFTIDRHLQYLSKNFVLPNFANQGKHQLLTYNVIQKMYQGILGYSYNYNLVSCMLHIMQKQVNKCIIPVKSPNPQSLISPSQYYLQVRRIIFSQFSYCLSSRVKFPNLLSLQGFIIPPSNNQQPNQYNFRPTESEQLLQMKLPIKKPNLINLQQFEDVTQFMVYDYVLLCSKLDSSEYYIGTIVEIMPNVKVKFLDIQNKIIDYNDKYPFVMYKIQNGKLYRKLNKSLNHCVINNLDLLQNRTYLLIQPPTFPILRIITELLSQLSTNPSETILIVTQFIDQIHGYLSEMGFKINKVTAKLKIDDKLFTKNQFVCIVKPQAICAQILKNYHFSRVIIEGAHKISQSFILMAIDKGCQQLYLIGDDRCINAEISSTYNRYNFEHFDMMRRVIKFIKPTHIKTFNSNIQPNILHPSSLSLLNKFFYDQLNSLYAFQSPLIRGFPWPAQNLNLRVAFINYPYLASNQDRYLNKISQLCALIIQNVVDSGFIQIKDIGCRVVDNNMAIILRKKLQKLYVKATNTKQDIHKKLNLNLNNPITNTNGSLYIPYSSVNRESVQNNQKITKDLDKIIDKVTGSRFNQKQLIIFLCVHKKLYRILTSQSNNLYNQMRYCEMSTSYFNACLQQNRRGLIVIGDLKLLHKTDKKWIQILEWANHSKIVLNYQK